MAVPVLTTYKKHEHVTEIAVGTVAPLIVAAAAVDQDTVGLVVSKVSPDNGIFCGNLCTIRFFSDWNIKRSSFYHHRGRFQNYYYSKLLFLPSP